MNKTKLIFGSVGALSVLVFIVIAALSLIMHDSYSILNSFVSELGKYPSGYLGSSVALLFNIALIASGLLMSVFWVLSGLNKESILDTAVSFFGILTGVLVAAQGIFTLNVATTHYIVTVMLFASAFITSVLYIISGMLTKNIKQASVANIFTAFAAGVVSAIFAAFVQFGNMPYILSVSFDVRLPVIPFAIVEWAALILVFAFVGLLATKMILSSLGDNNANTESKTKLKRPSFSLKKKSEHNMDF